MSVGNDFLNMLEGIDGYYAKDLPNDPFINWEQISKNYDIAPNEFTGTAELLPKVDVVKNLDGSVRSYDMNTNIQSGSNIASDINSNVITSNESSVKIPANTNIDSTTGNVVASSGAVAGAGGLAKVVKPKNVITALAMVGVLTQLGRIVNPEFYEKNLGFLDAMPDTDPEEWEKIAQEYETAQGYKFQGFDGLFNVSDNGTKGQLYLDQDAIAYTIKYLATKGAFSRPVDTIKDGITIGDVLYLPVGDIYTATLNTGDSISFSYVDSIGRDQQYLYECVSGSVNMAFQYDQDETTIRAQFGSQNSFRIKVTRVGSSNSTYINSSARSHDGLRYYSGMDSSYSINTSSAQSYSIPISATQYQGRTASSGYYLINIFLAYGTIIEGSSIEGIGEQEDASKPSFDPDDTYQDIIQKLQTEYPDMFNKKITQRVVQPDGSVAEYTYLPIPTPEENPTPTESKQPWEEPVTGQQKQNEPDVDPDTSTEPVISIIMEDVPSTPEPNKEDTGSGKTPPIVLPTGSAKALFRIWNPTQSEIDSLGAWLWSSQFIDQLLKMFSNPMEAIISLHKVFASPNIAGTDNITIGYLNSGVTSNYVNGQYVTVDCGSVSLPEVYQNVFDYAPFTEVSLYLPFVGIVKLDVSDVMRGTIHVVYHVDVVTGACLAEVNVTRDMFGGIIYTYTGNCAVQYPLSSGSYMGVVTSAVGLAAGAVATYATGGAAIPYLLRHGVGAVSNARTNVQRSGNFSANAGAMGCKKPYLIISRPQTNLATNFNMFVGKPANFTTKIGACTGFISCTDVHIENCNGTDSELAELENLLKSGIII